jgi:hypothetical protein
VSVIWKTSNTGLVGELPCGLGILVTSASFNSWKVRFGTAEIERKFDDVEEAKRAGVLLARNTLIDCLNHLADTPGFGDSIKEFWKTKASGT